MRRLRPDEEALPPDVSTDEVSTEGLNALDQTAPVGVNPQDPQVQMMLLNAARRRLAGLSGE